MDRQQRVEYALRLATARDDLADTRRHLDATRQEIAAAQRAIEDLTIDACTQRVRMKELALDEELVKRSEDEAIKEKIRAQARLAEIGGHESAARGLQRALDEARRELQATRDETLCVAAEETKMQQELVKLGAMLLKTRANSVKLQEDYSLVMREKRESDAKIKQLCLFLQSDAPPSPSLRADSPAASDASTLPSPTPSPLASAGRTARSPSATVHLGGGVEVAIPEVQF